MSEAVLDEIVMSVYFLAMTEVPIYSDFILQGNDRHI